MTFYSLVLCEISVETDLHFTNTWIVQVRPTTNQMNQASCCVIPPELKEFATENSVQLIAHSDPSGELSSVFVCCVVI